MNFKKILFFSLLIAILAVSAVSAVENLTTDDLTVQVDESDIQEIPIQEDIQSVSDDDVLGQVMTSDEDNQNESDSCGEDVLGVKMSEDDVIIKANTKTIDAVNPNSRIVTVTLPKGEYGYLDIFCDGMFNMKSKLSKIATKKTKNGFTTYTIRLKDLKFDRNISEEVKSKFTMGVGVKFYHDVEKSDFWKIQDYLLKFNKKAKTFKLTKKIKVDLYAGNYDRKSGTNKKLTIHLERYNGKPVVGKKVKITINGVVYVKKTNSKGLIKIYPPKYLAPKEFQKVHMDFPGDDKYSGTIRTNDIQIYKNPGSSKSKIKAGKKTFNVNKTKKYTVKLTSKGKAIKKAKLKLTIGGKKYTAKTNSKGKATFNLSKLAKKGKFKGTIVYMGDKRHYMTYKYVKLTVK